MLASAKPKLSKDLQKHPPHIPGPQKLSSHLLQAQDEERRRIARELHDGTGQSLTLLIMDLGRLRDEADRIDPALSKAATDCAQLAQQISDELRTISYLLHPPLLEELGLASALHWYIEGFQDRSGIEVAVNIPADLGRLPHDVETAVYRIVQESLTNVHRHSGSLTAGISLWRQIDNIVLEVRDDGRGIGHKGLSEFERGMSSGVGLRGMRERVRSLGGEMEIVSLRKGMLIRTVIPLPENEADAQS